MDSKRFWILVDILVALLVLLLVLVQMDRASAETARAAFVVLENREGILNVRTAPVDGEVVGSLYDGRDITVLDSLDGWALVSNPDDFENPLGWVCMDYIHMYGGGIEYEMEEEHERN